MASFSSEGKGTVGTVEVRTPVDEFLHAPVGSPDRDALEELKRHNTAVARTIGAAWDSAGLPTEKNFLRRKIKQVRREKASGRREPRTPPPDSGGER